MASSAANSNVSSGPPRRIPALLMRKSALPKRSFASASSRSAVVGAVMSASSVATLPPSSAASASRRLWRRAVSTRFAPAVASSRAMAAPMPADAPVITAPLPSIRDICHSPFCAANLGQVRAYKDLFGVLSHHPVHHPVDGPAEMISKPGAAYFIAWRTAASPPHRRPECCMPQPSMPLEKLDHGRVEGVVAVACEHVRGSLYVQEFGVRDQFPKVAHIFHRDDFTLRAAQQQRGNSNSASRFGVALLG